MNRRKIGFLFHLIVVIGAVVSIISTLITYRLKLWDIYYMFENVVMVFIVIFSGMIVWKAYTNWRESYKYE